MSPLRRMAYRAFDERKDTMKTDLLDASKEALRLLEEELIKPHGAAEFRQVAERLKSAIDKEEAINRLAGIHVRTI